MAPVPIKSVDVLGAHEVRIQRLESELSETSGDVKGLVATVGGLEEGVRDIWDKVNEVLGAVTSSSGRSFEQHTQIMNRVSALETKDKIETATGRARSLTLKKLLLPFAIIMSAGLTKLADHLFDLFAK